MSSPSPKSLILNLIQANEGQQITAAEAVGSAALFGIRENSVRVTLVRLSAAGMIASAGRGAYRLGPQAADMAQDLSDWRHREEQVTSWSGAWVMVSTGGLGRSDRVALRRRDRALALMGFKSLDSGLYVRPDNLKGHAAGVRERLHRLGLGQSVPVFTATDLDADLDARARSLWKGHAMTQGYIQSRQKLEEWLTRWQDLALEVAARESYLLGSEVIRQLVFDPLLPDPLVDGQARRAFAQSVLTFDQTGHDIWRRLLPLLNL